MTLALPVTRMSFLGLDDTDLMGRLGDRGGQTALERIQIKANVF